MIIPVLLLLTSTLLQAVQAEEEEGHYGEPSDAIVFPWFAQILGVIVFFILTRNKWIGILPFTAVMFLLGMAMGIGAARLDNPDKLTTSILQWSSINSEVLFLVFLPGLLFKDSFALNVHLFIVGFWQVINLAFPMVLAGTCLTALIAFYIFPYNWSWNLAMTFGSILSATDPVAVNVMLNDVGAPPRLKMHIGGESMMNDGSSYVFYTIFSLLFLLELGVEGLGEEVDLGKGVAVFFRMSLGGAAFGLAFGLGLTLLLYVLNHRLRVAENVTQIVATIAIAYLCYWVADIGKTSGVIATVICGITAKAFGNSMINDQEMMEAFWELVESLLNTLLFSLAGVVFGEVVSSTSYDFSGKDWGYLIMLFVLLNVIRFFLVFSWYPLISRIGLKSCWQETVFIGYAGLRGAVALTLSLSLLNEVLEVKDQADPKFETQVTQVFGMVGGVVFLALFINGTTSGPLLNKLGLARPTDARAKLLEDMEHTFRRHLVDYFVELLADERFQDVDFALVKEHLPLLQDLTLKELKSAVRRNKDITPNLKHVLPYLDTNDLDLAWTGVEKSSETEVSPVLRKSAFPDDLNKDNTMDTIELRRFYLGILATVYSEQLNGGKMDGRSEFVAYSLLQSIDVASSNVNMGAPLNDWEAAHIVETSQLKLFHAFYFLFIKLLKCTKWHHGDDLANTLKYQKFRINVLRALAFIEAHEEALNKFTAQFVDSDGGFRESEKTVVDEVKAETQLAREVLETSDKRDVDMITSHYFCTILLNQGAKYIEKLHEEGVLLDREATAYIERIEKNLDYARHCSGECLHEHKHQDTTPSKVVDNPKGMSSEVEEQVEDSGPTSEA